MSYYDYVASQELSSKPFYALLMAAMRQADGPNSEKLKSVFPEVHEELRRRYNNPGGCLDAEEFKHIHRPDFIISPSEFK